MTATNTSLSYFTVQPNRWTFEAPKIRSWVESRLSGRVLNACSGPTTLTPPTDGEIIRNDINPDVTADTHLDVRELDTHYSPNSFDFIIYDPPFSANQAAETYGFSDGARYDHRTKHTLNNLLKPGGTLLQFGYTTQVMPPDLNYRTTEIAVWNTLGRQHDWLATVVQKPTTDTDHTPEHAIIDQAIPNEHTINATTSAATSGNESTAIAIRYIPLPASHSLETAINTYLNAHRTGQTLELCDGARDLNHDDLVIQNSLTDTSTVYSFESTALEQNFANNVFDTVVFDPPATAFQHTTEYKGSTTGYDTAFKNAFHPLVKSRGHVIQHAHTATCMPSRLHYTRRSIAVFSHPAHAQDHLITIDEKQHQGINTFGRSTVPADIRDHAPNADTTGRHGPCVRCGDTWYHHPAWYTDCPTCGAAPENYCVHNGTISQIPHPSRITAFETEHYTNGQCLRTDTQHTPTTQTYDTDTEHTSPAHTHQKQQSLTAFKKT